MEQLAACHLVARKVSQHSFCSLPTLRHLSAICLLPTSFDLSLTFHKTSLSCLKGTIILNWAFSSSSPKPNTLKPYIWFSKNSKQLLKHLAHHFRWAYVNMPLVWPLTPKHILERKFQKVKLCSVSKYNNFSNRHNCLSCSALYSDTFSYSAFTFSSFSQIL